MFRPFIGRFTFVGSPIAKHRDWGPCLRGPHLTRSLPRLFTQRSPRRLLTAAACADLQPGPCRPTARDLLSSHTQLSFHTVKHGYFRHFLVRERCLTPFITPVNIFDPFSFP